MTERHGVPTTTPERTLLDLARTLPRRDLERAIEQAELRRLISPSLDEQLPQLTRSEAEARMLELIRRARLPAPTTNQRVGPYEVDLLWSRQRLIVEVDGYAFHSTRAAFERDRRRDAELQASGYRVLRITWRQISGEPEALIATLTRAVHS